ncbi:hypothetical protein [Roseisolibacter agri]|uniref:Uncharacterized protein n=1 Tax=Roseisolibacter agri TaxID=2014610 RepID=A0AA37Q816_9BACT|nr:hypothetical protein [Roseisolibacter agri]GLC24706.1 hypothetical protein rosag_12190 [Roseisolibacter agri]
MTITRWLCVALGAVLVVGGLTHTEWKPGHGWGREPGRPATIWSRLWFVGGGLFWMWLAVTGRV